MFTFGIITVAVFAIVILVLSYKIWDEVRSNPFSVEDLAVLIVVFAVLGVGLTSGIIAIVHGVSHFAA